MNDVLDWIGRFPGHAFVLGLFLLALAGILLALASNFFEFLASALCAFTGKYPPPGPPRPIVQCQGNCNKPCKCCEENECQVGCGCSSSVEVE
jgi:hypothetical protein